MTGDIVTCDACGQDWPEGSDQVVYNTSFGVWFCADEDACIDRGIA